MNAQALLSETAELLRWPVLVLMFAALATAGWELGRFAVERARRRRRRGLRGRLAAAAARGSLSAADASALPSGAVAAAALALLAAEGRRERQEEALADFELAAQRRLGPPRVLVRAGPALGLMGTLIPLAPGLGAVADGDVARFAGELRTAFAATVLGLAIGGVGFVVALVRARMYAEDLNALERFARALREARCDG